MYSLKSNKNKIIDSFMQVPFIPFKSFLMTDAYNMRYMSEHKFTTNLSLIFHPVNVLVEHTSLNISKNSQTEGRNINRNLISSTTLYLNVNK